VYVLKTDAVRAPSVSENRVENEKRNAREFVEYELSASCEMRVSNKRTPPTVRRVMSNVPVRRFGRQQRMHYPARFRQSVIGYFQREK